MYEEQDAFCFLSACRWQAPWMMPWSFCSFRFISDNRMLLIRDGGAFAGMPGVRRHSRALRHGFDLVDGSLSRNAFCKPDEQGDASISHAMAWEGPDEIQRLQKSAAKIKSKCAALVRRSFFLYFFVACIFGPAEF